MENLQKEVKELFSSSVRSNKSIKFPEKSVQNVPSKFENSSAKKKKNGRTVSSPQVDKFLNFNQEEVLEEKDFDLLNEEYKKIFQKNNKKSGENNQIFEEKQPNLEKSGKKKKGKTKSMQIITGKTGNFGNLISNKKQEIQKK